jgi:diguanylate cyclase (GGDEF)-like protein
VTVPDLSGQAQLSYLRPAPRVANRGVLLQTSGSEAGRVHSVADPGITLGRDDACTIRLDDATLSRVHARLNKLGPAYHLEDLRSLNGSFVNDTRVADAALVDGDRVRLAWGASFRFHLLEEEEERALGRMYESSVRDGLTGLYNRRHVDEQLTAEIAYAVRHGTELSVVMLDLDHFKRINDVFGHLAGDAVLYNVSALVLRCLRAEDVVARYGGEELIIVARGIAVWDAALLAERVRAAVEAAEVPFQQARLKATLSAGCASLHDAAAPLPADLIAAADRRLYQAKARGRNRVVASD